MMTGRRGSGQTDEGSSRRSPGATSRRGRTHCYAHQVEALLSLKPSTVLEVGVGAGVVTAMLQAMGLAVTTLDVRPQQDPDVVACVTDMPLDENAVDAALCCQVLEHMPFHKFRSALRELRRVCRKGCVLSLPDRSWYFGAQLWLPRVQGRFAVSCRRRVRKSTKRLAWETSGHYWECGHPEYSVSTVKRSIRSAGWTIASSWRVPEMPLHRMFLLRA